MGLRGWVDSHARKMEREKKEKERRRTKGASVTVQWSEVKELRALKSKTISLLIRKVD